jgi:hypothetical protein
VPLNFVFNDPKNRNAKECVERCKWHKQHRWEISKKHHQSSLPPTMDGICAIQQAVLRNATKLCYLNEQQMNEITNAFMTAIT